MDTIVRKNYNKQEIFSFYDKQRCGNERMFEVSAIGCRESVRAANE